MDRLARPRARAHRAGGGAGGRRLRAWPSGRNGGFCESLWLSAPTLRDRFGDGPARALLDASSESVGAIGAWCRDTGIDAWYRRSGYICVSTAPAFDGVGRAAATAAAALGAPERVVELDERDVRALRRAGVQARRLISDFATVQPARLALGLRQRLIERGALVFERTRVRALRSAGGRVLAETTDGSVLAPAAALAVGPAAGALPLRSRLAVTSSHIVLTERVPDLLDELGWTGGECITDGRTLALLPHHPRRPDRVRLGRGAPGVRRQLGGRMDGP